MDISKEHPVRVIEAIVDKLELEKLKNWVIDYSRIAICLIKGDYLELELAILYFE